MLRASVPTRLTTRLLFLVPFAALLFTPSPVLATGFGPFLGAASGFAALAGGPAAGAVTCTASTVTGDVGVVAPGTFVNTGCTIRGRSTRTPRRLTLTSSPRTTRSNSIRLATRP